MKKATDGLCIIGGCGNKRFSRGLCQSCYEMARSKIRRNRKVEQQLIDAKQMLPAETAGRKPKSALGKVLARKGGAK